MLDDAKIDTAGLSPVEPGYKQVLRVRALILWLPLLIAVNVIVFLIEIAAGSGGFAAGGSVIDDFGLFGPAVANGDWYRLISSGFLHAGLLHIGFNMYALYILGSYLEPLLGRARFLALYLISGIGGQVAVLLFAGGLPADGRFTSADADWVTPVVGASGAIFGLFGAMIVLNRHLNRSVAGIYTILIINAVLGFVVPGISWQAHLGGFLTGLASAGAIVLFRRQRVRHLTWVALGAVLALLIVITVVKYLTLPFDIGELNLTVRR